MLSVDGSEKQLLIAATVNKNVAKVSVVRLVAKGGGFTRDLKV